MGDNNEIRLRSLNYYISTIANDNFLFGGGITNTGYANSPVALGKQNNCYLSDLGMWGFFYQFGIQGCIALGYVYYSLLKKSKFCNSDVFNAVTFYLLIAVLQMITVSIDFSLLVFVSALVLGTQKE